MWALGYFIVGLIGAGLPLSLFTQTARSEELMEQQVNQVKEVDKQHPPVDPGVELALEVLFILESSTSQDFERVKKLAQFLASYLSGSWSEMSEQLASDLMEELTRFKNS